MNLSSGLENGLFALGQVLRLPVIVLLWAAVLLALYYAGTTLIDTLARRRDHRGFDLKRWLQPGPVLTADESRRAQLPAPLRTLLVDVLARRDEMAGGGIENLVAEHEAQARRMLTGPRALVRVGPSLGLLGTLIPMGGSLAAMAGGDLKAMAGQMVVAFTTTIIGLAVGTLAYVLATVRLSAANETVREQRFLAERIAAELSLPDVER
jgi:biopolymer transport protein ExbB/TolQ